MQYLRNFLLLLVSGINAQECSNSYECPFLASNLYILTESSIDMNNKTNCHLEWSFLNPTAYCLNKSCVYLIHAGAKPPSSCESTFDKTQPIPCAHILIERNILTTTGGYTKSCITQRYLQAVKTEARGNICYYPTNIPPVAGATVSYTTSEQCDDAIAGP